MEKICKEGVIMPSGIKKCACPDCEGTGKSYSWIPITKDRMRHRKMPVHCPRCDGTGEIEYVV